MLSCLFFIISTKSSNVTGKKLLFSNIRQKGFIGIYDTPHQSYKDRLSTIFQIFFYYFWNNRMDVLEVLHFFIGAKFELGNEYLKGLISSAILKLKKEGKVVGARGISYNAIRKELGIDDYKASFSISGFMKREMNTLTRLTDDDLINGLKFYASRVITKSQDAFDLLQMLNYDEGVIWYNSKIIAQRIDNLFGTTYDDAKRKYLTKIL